MKIIVVDGAGASSRRLEDRLGSVVSWTKVWYSTKFPIVEIKHSLFKWSTNRRLSRELRDLGPDEWCLIVAKSQGAWRVLDWLRKTKATVLFPRLHVITIDPHHWFMADCGIECSRPGLLIENFWQRAEHPKGFHVLGASNTLITGVDHWDIIHSEQVRAAIERAILKG